MRKKIYTAINIQYPWSQLIVEGSKIIETRTYPIPEKYLNCEMLLMETPGNEKFKARIIATIVFSKSFEYASKAEFRKDYERHLVAKNSKWDWDLQPKYGWVIASIKVFKSPFTLNRRLGIKYTTGIEIPKSVS